MPTEYIHNARKYTSAPNIAHGQSLLWSGPETGVQGVTELYECERTQDLRLQSVQNEFRMAFCGKKPTKHYMDYLRCILAVMSMGYQVATKTFVRNVVHWLRNENFMTTISPKQKTKDDLVRLLHPLQMMLVPRRKQLMLAPAIFANNDLKYGCNQIRAHTYGTRTPHGIVYSVAKDTASAEAFAAKADIIADKNNWLQQHDRES